MLGEKKVTICLLVCRCFLYDAARGMAHFD